jgi:hypothetical protein
MIYNMQHSQFVRSCVMTHTLSVIAAAAAAFGYCNRVQVGIQQHQLHEHNRMMHSIYVCSCHLDTSSY